MGPGDFLRAIVTMAAPNLSDGAKMVWDWELSSSDLPITLSLDGQDIVDAIIARYYTPLQGALSNKLTISQVELRAYNYPSDGFIAAGTLWTGTDATSMLPPANTLALQLLRTDFTMRNGRKSYPGACVSSLNANGGVSTSTLDGFATVTDGWGETSLQVEFDATDATFDEVVIRAPVSYDFPVIVSQRITEYSAVYFGTQNTRK